MTSTATTTRQELTELLASATTAQLAICLLAIDDMPADAATRRAGAETIEELTRRHPEVLPALDAWSLDLDTELSIIEATVAALPIEVLS